MKTLSHTTGKLMRLTWIGMLLLITGIAQAQVKTIQGLVLDETDQPLTGATVYTSDKKSSAITDLDGLFKLTNVNVGDTLVVSYVSYQTFKQVIKSSDKFYDCSFRSCNIFSSYQSGCPCRNFKWYFDMIFHILLFKFL